MPVGTLCHNVHKNSFDPKHCLPLPHCITPAAATTYPETFFGQKTITTTNSSLEEAGEELKRVSVIQKPSPNRQRWSYQGLILMKGMGAQVKKTVMRRKDFLPQMSDSAPIRGADRNDRKPFAGTQQRTLVLRKMLVRIFCAFVTIALCRNESLHME